MYEINEPSSQLFDRWIASSWHSYTKLISEDHGIPFYNPFWIAFFFSFEMLWQFISPQKMIEIRMTPVCSLAAIRQQMSRSSHCQAPVAFHHRTIASHCLTMTVTKYGLVMLLAAHITSPTLARRKISNRYLEPFTVTPVTPIALNWTCKCECHRKPSQLNGKTIFLSLTSHFTSYCWDAAAWNVS